MNSSVAMDSIATAPTISRNVSQHGPLIAPASTTTDRTPGSPPMEFATCVNAARSRLDFSHSRRRSSPTMPYGGRPMQKKPLAQRIEFQFRVARAVAIGFDRAFRNRLCGLGQIARARVVQEDFMIGAESVVIPAFGKLEFHARHGVRVLVEALGHELDGALREDLRHEPPVAERVGIVVAMALEDFAPDHRAPEHLHRGKNLAARTCGKTQFALGQRQGAEHPIGNRIPLLMAAEYRRHAGIGFERRKRGGYAVGQNAVVVAQQVEIFAGAEPHAGIAVGARAAVGRLPRVTQAAKPAAKTFHDRFGVIGGCIVGNHDLPFGAAARRQVLEVRRRMARAGKSECIC